MDATSSDREANSLWLFLSPQNKMPATTVPTTPIPVYAVSTIDISMVFIAR